MQNNIEALNEAGIQVVAISYDSTEILQRYAKKANITYLLLSDPESKAIDAYGIRNKEARGKTAGIPHPITFLVDDTGVIRAKLHRDGYRERHSSAELIEAAKKLP